MFCRDTVNLHHRFIKKAAKKLFLGHSVEEDLDVKLNYLGRSSKMKRRILKDRLHVDWVWVGRCGGCDT